MGEEEIKKSETENTNENPDKTGEKPILRDEKGLFIPGTATPNPAGRPKGSLSIVSALREKLKEKSKYMKNGEQLSYLEAFLEKMLKIALDKEDVAMIRDVVNRIDGLPKQDIGLTVDDKREDNPISDLLNKQNGEQRKASIDAISKLLDSTDEGGDISEELTTDDSEGDIQQAGGETELEVR